MKITPCEFPKCGYPVISKRLCTAHYRQRHRGQELRELDRPDYRYEKCSVTACEDPRHSRGLCSRHQSISNRFSIPPDQMGTLYDNGCQNPSCDSRDDLAIDHDHSCCPGNDSCGKCVRGVLCRSCNLTLGGMEKGSVGASQVKGLVRYMEEGRHVSLGEFVPVYRTKRRS